MIRLASVFFVVLCVGCRSMERENTPSPDHFLQPVASSSPQSTTPSNGVVVPFETYAAWQDSIAIYLPRMIGRGDAEHARILLIKIGRQMGLLATTIKSEAPTTTLPPAATAKADTKPDPFAPTIDRSEKALDTLPK